MTILLSRRGDSKIALAIIVPLWLRTRVFRALVTKRAAVWLSFCREEVTRTPDPHVPNVVRYQLRYFSVFEENLRFLLRVVDLLVIKGTQSSFIP